MHGAIWFQELTKLEILSNRPSLPLHFKFALQRMTYCPTFSLLLLEALWLEAYRSYQVSRKQHHLSLIAAQHLNTLMHQAIIEGAW